MHFYCVITGSVLQLYSQIGGKSEDLGRTQRFLEDAFQSGAATCLICIGSVKRNDAVRYSVFNVHIFYFYRYGECNNKLKKTL